MSRVDGLAACLLLAATFGCQPSRHPLRVVTRPEAGGVRMTLVAAPGAKINARLKPALEQPDGTILRFDSPALTSDSSYFSAPPELFVASGAAGTIRASVCDTGETVCRLVALTLR